MKKTLLIFTALTLVGTSALIADEAKSQARTQDSTEYKEDVQYKYRYQTEEAKEYKYKGDNNQPKYQYRHRNNMNDAAGSGMGNMRSMGSNKGGGKR